MSFTDNKTIEQLINATIIISLFFFLLMSVYVVKVSNNDLGGSTKYSNIPVNENKASIKIFNTTNSYSLQSFDLKNKEFNYYEQYTFCFGASVDSDSGVNLEVIDLENNVLGSVHVFNGSNQQVCTSLINDSFSVNNNFLGVKCLDCDGTNVLTLNNGLTTSVSTKTQDGFFFDSVIDYELIGVKNCKFFVLNLFKMYGIFVSLMGLVFLIIASIDWFERFSFDGW